MATNADIQKWTQTVYQQQYSLSNALTHHALAPTNLTKKEKKLEVLLFRAMMDYFMYHPAQFAAVVHTEETHQHYVCPIGVKSYCEISDVLFVVFSRQTHTLRMTHMQAKRKKVTEIMPQPVSSIIDFEFPIDLKQYHLLHGRVPFRNRGQSQYPIATFCTPDFSDSIASYGIFYLTQNKIWNLAYEVAPIVNQRGNKGEFYATNNIFDYINSLWMYKYSQHSEWVADYTNNQTHPIDELVSTLDTDVFESELIHCHVGSKIKRCNLVGDELFAYIGKLLTCAYRYIPNTQQEIVDAYQTFIEYAILGNHDIPMDEHAYPGSIVLIDADKVNNNE